MHSAEAQQGLDADGGLELLVADVVDRMRHAAEWDGGARAP